MGSAKKIEKKGKVSKEQRQVATGADSRFVKTRNVTESQSDLMSNRKKAKNGRIVDSGKGKKLSGEK